MKVIEELFEENESEKKILEDNNISEATWRRWLSDKYFIMAISNRIETASLKNRILLAKILPSVTARLVHLCSSDNEDVSRKACITLLELQQNKDLDLQFEEEPQTQLDPETASKILAILAERKRKPKENTNTGCR
ncbi:MAG: hypothetical protein A2Y10_09095 [Planctomycetes bacterium GWF2_41_51]|nr:MAG: hypothetical protein A2Y10_09095 [Planctomycetes bacterium GWF2_41_51]HBG26697.1 hypothetical protein [Phycisphaerales bacterium]